MGTFINAASIVILIKSGLKYNIYSLGAERCLSPGSQQAISVSRDSHSNLSAGVWPQGCRRCVGKGGQPALHVSQFSSTERLFLSETQRSSYVYISLVCGPSMARITPFVDKPRILLMSGTGLEGIAESLKAVTMPGLPCDIPVGYLGWCY